MEIYERIKYLRKEELKLSQEDFAISLNVSRSNLGNLETGRINVTNRIISDICKTYDVNENWLRTGEGEMFLPKSQEDVIIDAFGRLMTEDDNSFAKQFVSALAQLGPDEWAMIEKFARSVVEGSKKTEKKEEE